MKTSLSAVEYSIVYDLIERHGLSKSDATKLWRKRKRSKSKYKKMSANINKPYQAWKLYLSN